MKKQLVTPSLLFALAFSGSAMAESPKCGEPQDASCMQPADIQEKIETMGYTIEGMGISEGNCYALTGSNAQGQSVITYLDPKTGDVVQEDVAE